MTDSQITVVVAVIGFSAAILAVVVRYLLSTKRERVKKRREAKTELLLALERWWGSIKDYEGSMGEMGSASESQIIPQNPEMGIQMEDFEVVKIRAWPFLRRKTKHVIEETEGVFLGFITSIYAGHYNHEVYGDLVPKEIMRSDAIAEIMAGLREPQGHTFSDCREAHRKAKAILEN